MSINSAMLAGVSGLVANSSALAAISDNIANVNTVGYKRNQINFSNVVTAQAVKGRYSAGGVQGQPYQYVSQQGLLQTSSSPTDIAISGEGFFVVTEKSQNLTAADSRLFTRAGSFHVDSEGYLQNNAGFYLQGWPVDAAGNVDTNPSDLTRLQSINVKNIGATVVPTTDVQITANLDANTALSAAVTSTDSVTPASYAWNATTNPTAYDKVSNSMAAYDPVAGTGVKPDFTVQVGVVDSKGGTHTVSMSFLKARTPANTWNAEIYGDPAEIASGTGLAPGQIKSGTVVFNQDGTINLAGSSLFGGSTTPNIAIGASDAPGPSAAAANTAEWDSGLGITGQDIAFTLASSGGGLSQLASASTVKTVTSNGAGVGQVTGVEVDEDGFVSAVFDNGEVRKLAQIAVATFLDPDGLMSVSGNAYRPSITSGDYALKSAGQGGAGSVASSALEASTVDLSSEFTGLITTQRAYSASSRIIMTADQMMEELLNIKR
ncbi:MAG: flgE [Caulobacteraceae bacterium]|nr:flgE [Caulobacteraceae bacterium]